MRQRRDVEVREVGTRDGLQSIQTVFSTAAKLEWIRLEAAAGVPEIEVGSFVPPKLLPQMADSAEVVAGALAIDGLTVAALVPNFRGAQNALAAGARKLNYVLSVSEAHSQANVRRSVQESIEDLARIVEFRDAHPEFATVTIASGVATAFGCSIAGRVPLADVVTAARRLVEAGADELAVADTVGYGNPAQCREIFTEVLAVAGDVPVAAHFHDTRGLGLANVTAALEIGIRRFDASLGGLGGCPYAPGASGNVVMEDLVFMLEAMGLRTGVDLDRLMLAREHMANQLRGETTRGAYALAGKPKGFVGAAG
ncbi:MAG: hydroxymethylglutaryl-CoA lyase [Gammaproteobacteria bacterium]|nr:hydroxymethylglutaryl-CoA lyase [Gammaproteobacteria bacterium]MBI5615719.1 hydroxymethylglutaryl-CoA lyase [Gammaproteobacteria bacterium]